MTFVIVTALLGGTVNTTENINYSYPMAVLFMYDDTCTHLYSSITDAID